MSLYLHGDQDCSSRSSTRSSDAFSTPFTRFISIREISSHLYCDYDAKFVGAAANLSETTKTFTDSNQLKISFLLILALTSISTHLPLFI